MRKLIAMLTLGAAVALAGAAYAEEHEVLMLNKGEKGMMVFEPDFIRAAPGDTVRFVPTDKGHNAETIKGMIPEGAEPFKSAFNEEIVITLDQEGIYGVKCAPHYAMGMVALIEVGDPVNLEEARAVRHAGKARTVFDELFGLAVAAN
ncbi:MAG: pseudoazurin [Rhizobiaceae bacterium]|nr:pseudoazurin [Rhizobiaceae bacterium]